jgi:hypothetical protein
MNHPPMPNDAASALTNMWSSATTTERPPGLQRSLETAIYLNNAAVTLLTRHHVDEALDTMHDALLVLECVVRSSRSTMPLPSMQLQLLLLTANDTTCLMHKAASRLARSSITAHAETTCTVPVVVSFSGAIDGALLQQFSATVPSATSAAAAAAAGNGGWAIRINDAEFVQDDWLESVHEIVPAIFLSNLALIHFHCNESGDHSGGGKAETCTAFLTSPAATTTTTTTTALQWLDVALTLLIVHQRLVHVSEGNMCVALVILHNICTVQRDDDDDVASSRQQLALLQQMARQLCRFTNGGTGGGCTTTTDNDNGGVTGGVTTTCTSGAVTAAAA